MRPGCVSWFSRRRDRRISASRPIRAEYYTTVATAASAEIEVSRSRFIARVERVETEAAARASIAAVRAGHPRARHHCTAFVLGPDSRLRRSSDDGEPSGTAGVPMLEVLSAAGLSDVVAVVTRYFGGVLLGAAGLTRAYRASVAAAVERAPRLGRALYREVLVRSAYPVAAQIESEARRRGYAVEGADYAADVAQRYLVPDQDAARAAALFAELSGGAALVVPGEARFVDLPG